MKFNNINILGVLSGIVLAVSACTKTAPTPGGAASSTQAAPKVGFVLATMNEERYAKDRNYFEEAATKLGLAVEFAACDDKVDTQTAKVESLLAKGIKALVIQPVNGEAAGSIVELAKRDQVPVIAYDRIIKNADIDLYVTQDSFKVGVLQAEAAVKATGGKGNFVILMGEAGHSVADEITRGNLSVLERQPGIKVVVKQNHPGWATALALATVENTLTRFKNDVKAVLANNDGMALGAIQALEEQKLIGKVFVAGADADLTAVQNVVRDRLSLTILKGIRPLAQAAASSAAAIIRGEKVAAEGSVNNGKKEVPVVNTPVVAVDKTNVQTEIIDSGFHSAEAIFGKKSE